MASIGPLPFVETGRTADSTPFESAREWSRVLHPEWISPVLERSPIVVRGDPFEGRS
jgi:hypothetical protein